jgi:hypothetical protein
MGTYYHPPNCKIVGLKRHPEAEDKKWPEVYGFHKKLADGQCAVAFIALHPREWTVPVVPEWNPEIKPHEDKRVRKRIFAAKMLQAKVALAAYN